MLVSDLDENTMLVTSTQDQIEELSNQKLLAALQNQGSSERMYSANLLDTTSQDTVTPDLIKELAVGLHSSVANIQRVNNIIRSLVILNDIIGKTYESLDSNINTDVTVAYKSFKEKRNKQKTVDKVKLVIDDFHKQINLKELIRTSISLAYAEGNRVLYLRSDDGVYTVDSYPLGVVEVAPYKYDNNPMIMLNIKELEARLKKTYQKTKQNKPLIMENVEQDIKLNFPVEVYDAWKKKENYARLDSKYTGVMRINNMGRQYGVSPIFKAIPLVLALQNIEDADFINNKAKAKKIIHQRLRKEVMGSDGQRKGLSDAVHAHNELMQAWKNATVVYTSPPAVEKIEYVEPTVEDTSADKKRSYISQIMTALGMGFVDINVANFSVANISLDQLMKTINSISEQLETVLQHWYAAVLEDNGFDMEFLPTIKIIDSEQLSFEMKKDLVEILYNKLNCSRETAFEVLNISLEDEMQRRAAENDSGLDEIFYARENAYTAGKGAANDGQGNPKGGAPKTNEDEDKQSYDENYTEDGV